MKIPKKILEKEGQLIFYIQTKISYIEIFFYKLQQYPRKNFLYNPHALAGTIG
jgi:hypothetical protein